MLNRNIVRVLLYLIIPLAFILALVQNFLLPNIYHYLDEYQLYYKLISYNNIFNTFINLLPVLPLLFCVRKLKFEISLQITILFYFFLRLQAFLTNLFGVSSNSAYHIYWLTIVLGFFILLIANYYNWSLKKLKKFDPLNKEGVYLVLKKPNTIIQLIQVLFGLGVGSFDVFVNSKNNKTLYHFTRKTSVLTKTDNIKYHEKYINNYSVNIYDNPERFEFLIEKHGIIGSKYHIIKNSCLTVWKPVFNEIGIKIKTIFVSRFIKKRISIYNKNIEL